MPPIEGAGSATPALAAMDAVSAQWVRELRSEGPERDAATERLFELLLRVAHAEVRRRGGRYSIGESEADDLAYQAAADASVSILRKVDGFRGESRFTTWAYAFAVVEVSSKLGRHYWRRPHVTLSEEAWAQWPDRFGLDPQTSAEDRDLARAVRDAVETVLTARQRHVFVSIVVEGVPLDALAARLGTNRNALYKTMFDARRKVRAALVTNGYLQDQTGGER